MGASQVLAQIMVLRTAEYTALYCNAARGVCRYVSDARGWSYVLPATLLSWVIGTAWLTPLHCLVNLYVLSSLLYCTA